MDAAFRVLIDQAGLSLTEAARLCATTPAAEMGLSETGSLRPGHMADLVVLAPGLRVRQTYIAGVPVLVP